MSLVLSSPTADSNNHSVYVHITHQHHRPKFLLSPPPPPKHKRALTAAKLPQPPTPPHTTTKRAYNTNTPRSPLESFLNLLDTPSPPSTVNSNSKRRDVLFTLNDLGYNIAIESFYTSSPKTTTAPVPAAVSTAAVPVTPRPKAFKKPSTVTTTPTKPQPTRTTTKPLLLFGMNILSRQQTHSSKPSSSTSAKAMPLHSRSNQAYEPASSMRPPMPEYAQQPRRGSLPTTSSSSSSQNHPRFSSSKTSSSSRSTEKDINKAQNKRYPLPLPYSSVVEMDQILGDTRSAHKVSSSSAAYPASTRRGPTAVGPHGEVSIGRPYVGADGRVWRDREEELEYAGLLASSSNNHDHDAYRRGSDDTTGSIDDVDGERQGRRAWAKFGAGAHAYGTATTPSKQGAGTTYDRFHASEHRLRMPHSATSSGTSSDTDDEDAGGEHEPWSPLVETHAAQHHFPSYVFPGSGSSKSSRVSSSTTNTTSAATGRAIPLPVSVNDFAVPGAPHRGVPRAKEDFLASAFAPVPAPTTPGSRERSRPPTTTGTGAESRMTTRRSSVQGQGGAVVGRNEIVVPLPSLKPGSGAQHGAVPVPVSSAGKEKSGFLGVFKKK